MDNTPHQPGVKARVFIVEDERIIAEDIKARLIKNGYEVLGIASTGNDAIEQIKQLHPDVVIMDVHISGSLDGIEVAIIIQSYFDSTVPIIFLTGFSENTFQYLKVVPDYIYLNKPFQESVLLEAMERALKKKNDG